MFIDVAEALDFSSDEEKVYYLGYDLGLTHDEYKVISEIIKKNSEIGELLTVTSLEKQMSSENLAVHVCNINKKIRTVGGRRIIEKRNGEYILQINE